MAKISGRFLRLSIPRRMVGDMLYAGQQLTLLPIQRRMRLGALMAARAACEPRPSWCALFTKALAVVTSRHPELRHAYFAWPWPRLFEYDRNSVSVVIERDWRGESALFLARIAEPERMSVLELDRVIRKYKEKPVEKISGFRGALRFARLPHLVRRGFWRLTMNALPLLRGKLLGTMGVSVTAGMGAAGIFTCTPWTITLLYDVFDSTGALDVRLTFDHRVMDGAALAVALAEIESELCGPILNELAPARQAAA